LLKYFIGKNWEKTGTHMKDRIRKRKWEKQEQHLVMGERKCRERGIIVYENLG
jgi:hypothetical protein